MQIPKNVHIFDLAGVRLPRTGMTVREAVDRGKKWWGKSGRDFFRRTRDRKVDGIKDDKQLMHDSGILSGKLWDDLSTMEKEQVTLYWYAEFCGQELGKDETRTVLGDQIAFGPMVEELNQISDLIYQEFAHGRKTTD